MKKLIFAVFTIICTSAFSTDLTVFGLTLGAPLTLPECTQRMIGTTAVYETYQSVTCAQKPHPMNTYGQPVRVIDFPKATKPLILSNFYLIALESGGNLVGVRFATNGISDQEFDLTVLTNKYGKPTSIVRNKVQNKMGAVFESIEASWNFSDLTVTLKGSNGELNFGEITVDTPIASKLRKDWIEKELANLQKM